MKRLVLFLAGVLAPLLTFESQAQWIKILGAETVKSVPQYVDSNVIIYSGGTQGIYRIADAGATWLPLGFKDTSLTPILISGLADSSGNAILLAGSGRYVLVDPMPSFPPAEPVKWESFGIWRSSDNGHTWTPADTGLATDPSGSLARIYAFAVLGKSVIAGTSAGLYRSIDNGKSWTAVVNSIVAPMSGAQVYNLVASGGIAQKYLFANAHTRTGLSWWRSNDEGSSWVQIPGLSANGLIAHAGTGSSLYFLSDSLRVTTNGGDNWLSVSPPGQGAVTAVAVTDGALFTARNQFVRAGSGVGKVGVYLSTNSGYSWKSVGEGLPAPGPEYYTRLFISGRYLYATIDSSGLWRRPLSELVTTVLQKSDSRTPATFELAQNFPNPFNPRTTIEFSTLSFDLVTLKVFDVLGKQVVLLVNELRPAGVYTERWDATSVPSGVYYYSLRVGSSMETKKMLVVR